MAWRTVQGQGTRSINDRINLMFQDADLMPLMIAENYVSMIPSGVGLDDPKRMVLCPTAPVCENLSRSHCKPHCAPW
jgi:hypothetical protein